MWHDTKLLNATANVLFGLCVCVVLVTGLWLLINRPMFALSVIQLEGKATNEGVLPLKHVNAEIIRSTALMQLHGNFFTTNLDQVRQTFEQVPWVRKASVRREWPHSLIVTIEEHEVLGTWGEDGQLLSQQGDVFTANLAEAEEDADLLEFTGPAGSEKDVLQHYLEFKQWFGQVGLIPESINYSSRYAWLIKMNTGLMVQLGREESSAVLQERVMRLVKVYPELNARLQGKIESVDLRYANGFALTADGQESNVVVKPKK